MKKGQCKNLHLAGIDVVLPAVLSINGRATADWSNIIVSLAPGYMDNTIAPLAAAWLSQHLHLRFVEGGRGAAGNLAAEAFYDKLAREFANDRAFVAMLVSQRRILPRSLQIGVGIGQTNGPAKRQRESHGRWPGFMKEIEFARWNLRGRMRAYMDPKAGTAQVTFDALPGGVELINIGKFAETVSRRLERAHEAAGWYGFGVLTCSPADAIAALRDELREARGPGVEARVAAHV